MKFILGKKLDMTQVWRGDDVVPVTRIQAGPCTVVQIKNKTKDKYSAIQICFDSKKEKNINKAQIGHVKKAEINVNPRYMREFRMDKNGVNEEIAVNVGDEIDALTFAPGDIVKITGTSKGKGFQGVVKQFGFSGSKKTHGNKDQERMPGSNGATGPAHVFKGARMPGRMGGDQVTTTNLEIVEVDKENNILLVKGAVPGVRNGLVMISGKGQLAFNPRNKISEPEIIEPELKKAVNEDIEEVVVEAHEKIIETEKLETKEEK
jgi:large subunit ribosomal protein L3